MKKSSFLLIVMSFMVSQSSSCDKVCEIIYLADMICKKLAVAVPTVQTGTAFAITTLVKNVAESTELCETASAGTSDTKYNVKYREDENTPWSDTEIGQPGSLVFDVFVPTDGLDPEDETGFEPEFRMQTPGQYRFEGFADGKTTVPERDENNNGGGAQGQQTGRSETPPNVVIVTVVPGPDYVPHKGKPIVEYLGYKKLF